MYDTGPGSKPSPPMIPYARQPAMVQGSPRDRSHPLLPPPGDRGGDSMISAREALRVGGGMRLGLGVVVVVGLALGAIPRAQAQSAEIVLTPAFPNMDFDGYGIGLHRSRLGASGPLRWF